MFVVISATFQIKQLPKDKDQKARIKDQIRRCEVLIACSCDSGKIAEAFAVPFAVATDFDRMARSCFTSSMICGINSATLGKKRNIVTGCYAIVAVN